IVGRKATENPKRRRRCALPAHSKLRHRQFEARHGRAKSRGDLYFHFAPLGFAESHAATIKQTPIMIEKTSGRKKKYLTFRNVSKTKQIANDQPIPRARASVSASSRPSCQATTAESNRNKLTRSPNPTKKSQ